MAAAARTFVRPRCALALRGRINPADTHVGRPIVPLGGSTTVCVDWMRSPVDQPLASATMNFVILTQYYPPEIGAAQVRLASFARELRHAGHDVVVVTAMPNYPSGRISEPYRGRLKVSETLNGIRVIRTWLYPSQSARFLPRLVSYFTFAATSLLAAPGLGKPDVIFVESPPLFLAITAQLMAWLSGARWIMNLSDLWPDTVVALGMIQDGPLLRLAYGLERWLYSHAHFVVAVTEGIATRLREDKGVPAHKVLFLPNGVDVTLFRPRPPDSALAALHALQDKSIFIYAGLHGHAQDLPTIIHAAAMLHNRSDIAIVLIGDGPVKAEAVAMAEARSLSNVSFIPPQPLEEMPRWWSLARGALVTLRDTPLFAGARPSKAFPPLASGVPIIYGGRGELADILREADAGIIVPPGEPQALAEACARMADDGIAQERLSGNARRLAERDFSWRMIVTRWLDDYRKRGGP